MQTILAAQNEGAVNGLQREGGSLVPNKEVQEIAVTDKAIRVPLLCFLLFSSQFVVA